MDQIKIGKFIAACRKAKNLTQMQLAEALGITDRAVSKWERGISLPDSSIMLALCGILEISVNDLLSGEVVTMSNYNEKAEENLLALTKQKQEADRQLLRYEIVIGILSIVVLFAFVLPAAYLQMEDWLRVVLVITGFVFCLVGLGFALRIEQTAGYYECRKCHHKHVPGYQSVVWAMHLGRTRYMKCPNCQKWSWQKKRLTKD